MNTTKNMFGDYKSEALSDIAQSLAQSNRVDDAAKLYDDAIKVANAIKDIDDRSKALSHVAQSLARSNKLDQAMQLANAIKDIDNWAQALSKIISEKLKIKNRVSGMILQIIVTRIVDNLYETYISRFTTQELWNYVIKQSIGYPEIAYIVCSFIAERYPKFSSEIAYLISKYDF
jgi:hypothetical protein